ncbi:MAG: MgtC/SapB family protein [Drouetiella hepatica Uher 2000/2452]|uniref:MgtC/SapB family protein n=1 Tax=Drouetiella hepatica Uher 2000/2452 TaxID=904376 RepID=A0A951UPG0_9CYAN|nr:MgtC/SapB family protein [Drouetiella hepatica Uher 2000/2452]
MPPLDPTDWFSTLARLSLALFVGGLVGLERQIDRKPAGLRTHMLVSLGASLFVMTGLQLSPNALENTSRIIQGIVSGIGFLGAGEIFAKSRTTPDEVKIQGLTSAAAIWVSASLGVAAGCGLWFMALSGAIATIFVLLVIKRTEKKLDRNS